jgi:hypothetical protein
LVTGSRGLAVAAALAVLGTAIILWRVTSGGDDKPKQDTGTATAQRLNTRYVDDRLGISLRIPDGWSAPSHGRVARFASGDHTISLAVIRPARQGTLARLQNAAEVDLARRFGPARVLGRLPGRVGGLPAKISELAGHSGTGAVRLLVAVTQAQGQPYLFEVLSSNPPRAARLLEARAMLADVRFSKATG